MQEQIPFYKKNYHTLLFLFFLTFSVLLPSILLSQSVCNNAMTKKYVTLTEKIAGTAKLTAITSHSVVAVPGGFWMGGLATLAGGNVEFFYAKANDTGKLLYFKTIGLSTNEGGFSIRLAATPSGGIIITGQNADNTISANLGAIVSIDNQGSVKWYRKTPSAGNNGVLDAIRCVTVDPNGDVIIAGDAQQYSNLNYSRVLVAKLDSNGNSIFINQVNMSIAGNNQQAHPTQILSTPIGYLIGGWITGSTNPFLLLIDKSSGAAVNSIYLSGTSNHSADKILFTPSGKVFLVGYTNKNGTPDGWAAAVNITTGTILWQKGIATTGGANDYFNHAYLDKNIIYMSMQSNGLGGGGLRQGFVGIDTNGNLSSGNSIYFGTRRFSTSNAGMDFDVLKTNGTVFFGQDNGATGVRLNFAIMSPCSTASCANHTQNYTTFNTTLVTATVTATDVTQGSLTTHSPTITVIPFNENIECRQSCVKPKNLLADTALLCSATTLLTVNPLQTITTCTYLWDDNDANSAKNFTTAGTYYLTTTNSCASIKDTLVVVAGDFPKSPSFKDTTYCTTGWSLYKNIAQTGCTYIWDNASTKSYRTFTNPGKFWVETTNSCGKRIDTITIKQGIVIVMPPKLQDTGICIGETIIVNITPKLYHTYLWDDGDTNASRGFNFAGKKYLTVITACDVKYDSFNIVLRKKPVKAPIKDTVFCARPILYTANATQPNCNYAWSDGSTSPIKSFTYEGKWWLLTSNRCGNRMDSIQISKDTTPVKVLNDDEYFCLGQPLIIKAAQPFTGKFNYVWSNGDKGPETIVPYSANISLITSNACGSRTDFVNVNSYRCDCDFYVPNAFTPGNADNLNDGWYPRFDCQVKTGYYSIFNRWGETIVDKKNVSEPWDGRTADGTLVPDGIYAYLIHGLYENTVTGTRTFDQFGDLTILSGKKP